MPNSLTTVAPQLANPSSDPQGGITSHNGCPVVAVAATKL